MATGHTRVVLAEEDVLLREGLGGLLERSGTRSRLHVRNRPVTVTSPPV